MNPLIVTAFYDIGRGQWQSRQRTRSGYVGAFRKFVWRLSENLYLLCDSETNAEIDLSIEYRDMAALPELKAFQFHAATAEIMSRPAFRDLFSRRRKGFHPETELPLYNIVMMAKWDALERAHRMTEGRYSHYVWVDFGFGKHAEYIAWLSASDRFRPIERQQIVLSATFRRLPQPDCRSLAKWVRTFHHVSAGNAWVVPEPLVGEYVRMARSNYERLLACGLTCDDQLVVDMCIAEKPDMFYLSFQRRHGRKKYAHSHDILLGKDRPTLKSSLMRTVFAAMNRH